ncbi:MAG: E2/UBC family protein [Thermodesulfobacteriota bacterium]|jgi:hypothetical protein
MGLPPQLESDIKTLQEDGWKVSAHRNPPDSNQIFIIFEEYPLPPGWNKKETKLLLITDISYPNSRMDMFWVDPDLRLMNGDRIPQAGGLVETYLGQRWQRFSWHVQRWNPAIDSIITYLGTVDARLRQKQ